MLSQNNCTKSPTDSQTEHPPKHVQYPITPEHELFYCRPGDLTRFIPGGRCADCGADIAGPGPVCEFCAMDPDAPIPFRLTALATDRTEEARFDPWRQCPNCDSRRVYGNGIDARELACPDCGMQYNPRTEAATC